MAQWVPTDDDNNDAIRQLLTGLAAGEPLYELEGTAMRVHRKHNTFPAEVYMLLAADALDLAAATREAPIKYEGLIATHLSGHRFRGRERGRIQHAVLLSGAVQGGIEPDLLDEEIWRHGDDYWRYALYATVALIRAGAEHRGISVARMAEELADRSGIKLA